MNYKVLITLMDMEIGGAQTYVLELCKALKRRGVSVICASNGGAYEKELVEAGIVHCTVPLHNTKVKNLIASYRMLQQIIVDNDIRLVHAHARIPAFVCGLLQKRLKFRFVTTVHGLYKTSFPFNVLTNWGERSLAVSEDLKLYLMKNYHIPEDHIELTVNGIDTDRFHKNVEHDGVMKELGLNAKHLKIMHVSRIDKESSLPAHKLIELAPLLFEISREMDIVIVGTGTDFEAISAKADQVNKKIGRKMVHLAGHRVDIHSFLTMADIFVGVSRAAMEAMAAERPCILAGAEGYIGIFDESKLDIGIHTNFCCRGQGELTNDKLLTALKEMLSRSRQDWARLGEYGRKIVMEYYSLDRMAVDSLRLYDRVRRRNRKTDVVLSGYYGYNNNGDDAILQAILDGLRERKADLQISVISVNPKQTQAKYGVHSVKKFNLLGIWRLLRDTDLLITGGGSLIQDSTSTQSLFYYLAVIMAARLNSVKTMLFAHGIGPVKQKKNKYFVQKVFNQMDLIALRDEASFGELENLAIDKPPVVLTADIAFCLSIGARNEGKKLLQSIGVSDQSRYFCISVRRWKLLRDDFVQEMAEFADYVKKVHGFDAVFIPMQPDFDTEISWEILSGMRTRAYYIGEQYSTDALLGIVSGAEFLVGMRLHTIIYAYKFGVPSIGLVYDPKVKALMDMLEQPYYLDVEQVSFQALQKFADELVQDRKVISETIAEKNLVITERAKKNCELAYELLMRGDF